MIERDQVVRRDNAMFIEREVASEIERALEYQAAVALIGPRQVGKTTVAMQIGSRRDSLYLDLEDERDRAQLREPHLLLEANRHRLVILDEIYRAPEIFLTLRGIIDKGRGEGFRTGRFLILGSASLDLLRQSGETLAGRIAYIDMTPLTATEIPNELAGMEKHWLRGGFPDSFLANSNGLSFEWRKNLIRTYLERDVPLFGFNIPSETLERLWTMLAHRHGGILNASDLAQSLSISTHSVGRYVDLLVDLLLVRRLRPFHANVGKRLVKSPKVYVRDSGLIHALLEIETIEQLSGHPGLGMSWEGFVIESLASVLPWRSHVFFYRTRVGAEIDLVIEHGDGSLWAIEIKRSLVPKIDRGFHVAREDIEPARSFVVHAGDDRFPLTAEIEAIGLTELMRELAVRS